MSLTSRQKIDTVDQFSQNMALLGLSPERIAHDLGSTAHHVERVARLDGVALEDPWILRNYLLDEAAKIGVEPVPFTALVGDHHDYWFPDATAVDQGRLAE